MQPIPDGMCVCGRTRKDCTQRFLDYFIPLNNQYKTSKTTGVEENMKGKTNV